MPGIARALLMVGCDSATSSGRGINIADATEPHRLAERRR